MIHKNPDHLRALIGTLKSNGITRYKCPEFTIELDLGISENEQNILDAVDKVAYPGERIIEDPAVLFSYPGGSQVSVPTPCTDEPYKRVKKGRPSRFVDVAEKVHQTGPELDTGPEPEPYLSGRSRSIKFSGFDDDWVEFDLLKSGNMTIDLGDRDIRLAAYDVARLMQFLLNPEKLMRKRDPVIKKKE